MFLRRKPAEKSFVEEDRCNRIFNLKHHLQQHLNKKKPCRIQIFQNESIYSKMNPNESPTKEPINEEKQEETTYKCKYCEKYFSTNSNMNKHVKRSCKDKKHVDNFKKLYEMFENFKKQQAEKEKEMKNNFLKENKEIKKENKKLLKEIQNLKTGSLGPANITINTDNSVTNNIQLNNYGQENTSYLATSEFINKIKMQSNVLGLLSYENEKHCNPMFITKKTMYTTPKRATNCYSFIY